MRKQTIIKHCLSKYYVLFAFSCFVNWQEWEYARESRQKAKNNQLWTVNVQAPIRADWLHPLGLLGHIIRCVRKHPDLADNATDSTPVLFDEQLAFFLAQEEGSQATISLSLPPVRMEKTNRTRTGRNLQGTRQNQTHLARCNIPGVG